MQRDDIETVIREAGELACEYFQRRGSLNVELKQRQDLVSEADRAVEQLLRRRLHELYPEDAILGEEYGMDTSASEGPGTHPRKPEAIWVIDPIDGTSNFLRGIPEFAITLCRVVEGEPEQGYIYHPLKDQMLSAVRHQGAWSNGLQHRISQKTIASDAAILGLGYGLKSDRPQQAIAMMARWSEAGCLCRQVGSAAVALCMAILEQTDGFYEPFLNSWDALAGQMIAVEAGLKSSPFLCGEKLTTGGAVWVSRPELFDLVNL